MKINIKKSLLALPLIAVAGLTLTGCSERANTTASCSFVIGNGSDGNDSKIHHVKYPGDTFTEDEGELTRYFPCNARTFIINPDDERNASGNAVGDRHTPVYAYSKEGTKVKLWLTAYWTLNQNPEVLKGQFAPVCLKFTCWSGEENANNANFSTDGWNGMLGETFSKGTDQTALQVVHEFADAELFKQYDPEVRKRINEALSKAFADNVRPTTGATDDLFCGSGGTSGWDNPSEPGKGTFNCGQVRFVVDSIEPADASLAKQTADVTGKDAKIKANQDQREIATAKYGADAEYWLGLQDTAKQCADKCTIVVGKPSTSTGQ